MLAFCFLTSFHPSSSSPNSEAKIVLNAFALSCEDVQKDSLS